MRAFWDTELPECNTLKDTFTALGQKETRIPYMALCDTFEHIECQSDSFDVAFFPLEAESYGNEWELVVFLPKENSADVLKGFPLIVLLWLKMLDSKAKIEKDKNCKIRISFM